VREAARILYAEREGGAVVRWGRILHRLLAGDLRRAYAARLRARERSAHVEQALQSPFPLPSGADAFTPFGEDDAAAVRRVLRPSWTAHPEALAWLRSQGRARSRGSRVG